MKSVIIIPMLFLSLIGLASAAITDGNIGYWKMDNDTISGTTVSDSAGLRNGSLSAAISGASGKIKDATGYDGSDDFMSFSTTTTMSQWSVAAWVRFASVGGCDTLWDLSTNSNEYKTQGCDIGGTIDLYIKDSADTAFTLNANLTSGAWYHLVYTKDSSNNQSAWLNGQMFATNIRANTLELDRLGDDSAYSNDLHGSLDEVGIWNRPLSPSEISVLYNNGVGIQYPFYTSIPPTILKRNCTSCSYPIGDTVSPYTTLDTTPTFKVDTDIQAMCAISKYELNYSSMISQTVRNCTTTGASEHICTLPVIDQILMNETGHQVFISCRSLSGYENITSTSGPLILDISSGQVEILGDEAIMAGINASEIWPATVESNQQIYIRDKNNNQKLATFDKVALKNDKRWAFNYLLWNDSFISNLFNLTPVFYALEMKEQTYQQVNNSVRNTIDSTN